MFTVIALSKKTNVRPRDHKVFVTEMFSDALNCLRATIKGARRRPFSSVSIYNRQEEKKPLIPIFTVSSSDGWKEHFLRKGFDEAPQPVPVTAGDEYPQKADKGKFRVLVWMVAEHRFFFGDDVDSLKTAKTVAKRAAEADWQWAIYDDQGVERARSEFS